MNGGRHHHRGSIPARRRPLVLRTRVRAFLEAGLVAKIETAGHTIAAIEEVEHPGSERRHDTVANLGRIATKTAALVLEGDCSHAVVVLGGPAPTFPPPNTTK